MSKIQPIIPRKSCGFLPQEIMRRNAVVEIIRKTFEQFGYSPIETPIIYSDGKDLGAYDKEEDWINYSFKDRGVGCILPHDLTFPFARFVKANYQKLPIPFKRYQIQRVWQAESERKRHLREFYQCAIDIIGAKSLICEAEVVRVIIEVFKMLRITNIRIKVNSGCLIKNILQSFGLNKNDSLAFRRIIGRIPKIGEHAVIAELQKIGLNNAEKIIAALSPAETNKGTLKQIYSYGITELEEFLSYCNSLGVPEKNLQIDPTLMNGLDYYTGLVFEVISEKASFGSICTGGHYENPYGLFSDEDFSGVGVAFDFERIMILLEQLKIFSSSGSPSQVLIALLNENSVDEELKIYNKLIEAKIAAEIYLEPDKLSKQFKFADKKQIPFVIIRGPEEQKEREVKVKRMQNGKQKTIPVSQLISYLSNYYETK